VREGAKLKKKSM